jgi:hypothetical protein
MINAREMFREALKQALKEAPTPGAAHRASHGARLSPTSARLDPPAYPPGEFAATAPRPRISGATEETGGRCMEPYPAESSNIAHNTVCVTAGASP